MIRLAPKQKMFVIILIGMIALHMVLSFFGCMEVTYVSRFDDFIDESVDYESLLPWAVLISAGLRIALIFSPSKVCQVLSCLTSLAVSVLTSSWPFLMEAYQLVGGLAWTNYCLSPFGIFVVAFSWAITIFNVVLTGIGCRNPEKKSMRGGSAVLVIALTVLIVLALILFRNVLIDRIRQLIIY